MNFKKRISDANKRSQSNKKSFDRRSTSVVKIARQIRKKNELIKKEKRAKKENGKAKVKKISKVSNNFGGKGFVNIGTLSLIISVLFITLFMFFYTILGGK